MWATSNKQIKKVNYKTGFTLVELLIVIVVIAILAAITIVAYRGITQRAVISSLSSDLESSAKQLKLDMVDLGSYPAATPTASNGSPSAANVAGGGAGLKSSNGTTYQYHVNNAATPPTFCLTATNGSTSYYITQGSGPTAGGCPGDGVGGVGAVTNLITNPSIEAGSTPTGYNTANGSSLSVDTTTTPFIGNSSLKVTLPTGNAGFTGTLVATGSVGAGLAANSSYTLSAYVFVPSATTAPICLSVQGTGVTGQNLAGCTSIKQAWTRINVTLTTLASGSYTLYVLNGAAVTSGMIFNVDAVMLTIGSTLYGYADGTTPNWLWNGTANASTSTGPAQ